MSIALATGPAPGIGLATPAHVADDRDDAPPVTGGVSVGDGGDTR